MPKSKSPKRSFTVVTVRGTKGRYISKTPAGAAKKAASKVLKRKRKCSPKSRTKKCTTTTLKIRETTQGSTHKVRSYKAKKVFLRSPKTVDRDGTTVKYRSKIVVKAK